MILHTYVYNGDRIPMPPPISKQMVSVPQYNFAGYQMWYPKKIGNAVLPSVCDDPPCLLLKPPPLSFNAYNFDS